MPDYIFLLYLYVGKIGKYSKYRRSPIRYKDIFTQSKVLYQHFTHKAITMEMSAQAEVIMFYFF